MKLYFHLPQYSTFFKYLPMLLECGCKDTKRVIRTRKSRKNRWPIEKGKQDKKNSTKHTYKTIIIRIIYCNKLYIFVQKGP